MTETAEKSYASLPGFVVRHRQSLVVAGHGALFALALLAAFLLAYNFHWVEQKGVVHPWLFELYLPLIAARGDTSVCETCLG